MTIAELLPLINLVLLPILVYVIKLERNIAVLGEFKTSVEKKLGSIDGDIKAVHQRLDRFNVPHASSSRAS